MDYLPGISRSYARDTTIQTLIYVFSASIKTTRSQKANYTIKGGTKRQFWQSSSSYTTERTQTHDMRKRVIATGDGSQTNSRMRWGMRKDVSVYKHMETIKYLQLMSGIIVWDVMVSSGVAHAVQKSYTLLQAYNDREPGNYPQGKWTGRATKGDEGGEQSGE